VIRAIIADDEPLSRRAVHQLLTRHDDVRILAECGDGEAVLDAIVEHRPDVLFLDVRMPLASGLDVARRRDAKTGPLVVFVSAFDEFALPAFEVDAVDYVTKPLMEDRFDAALSRVRDRLRGRRTYPQHLVSRVGPRDVVVRLDAVDYIEAEDVYAAVHAGGKHYLVRVSLDRLEESLDPDVFVRVHRSYIVRAARVAAVRRDAAGSTELLVGETTIPVSRRRRSAIEAILRPLTT
jgi:two-component system, LytTR family, response regulator